MREPNEPFAPIPPAPQTEVPGSPWRPRLKRWAPLAVTSAISLLVGIFIGVGLSGGSSESAASGKPCPEAQVVEAGSAPGDTAEEAPQRPARTGRSRRGGEFESSTSGGGSGHF